MGDVGTLPPFLAVWIPLIITFLFALTRLLYAEEG
jgi:lipopolysaccharide export LptBFGC system permease protein LptF